MAKIRKYAQDLATVFSIAGGSYALFEAAKKRYAEKEKEIIEEVEATSKKIENNPNRALIDNKLEFIKTTAKKTKNIVEQFVPKEKRLSKEELEKLANEATANLKDMDDAASDISKLIEPEEGKFSSDGIRVFINEFQEFVGSLSFEQGYAFGHILFIVGIFFLVLNLASVFYSETLIKYLELNKRFPKIKKLLELRTRFQGYYFTINFMLVILVLIFLFLYNMMILIS